MKPSTFFYNIRQGFKGVFRNSVMSTASVLVLVACMILIGTIYVVIDTIDVNFKAINDLNVIEVRLDKSYNDEQIAEIGDALEQIRKTSPIIEKELVFVSADEHLQILKERFPDNDWINGILDSNEYNRSLYESGELSEEEGGSVLVDNPLRASYRLEFVNLSDFDEVTRVKSLIDEIKLKDESGKEFDAVDSTNDIRDNIELYGKVMNVKNTLYVAGIWLLAIFLIIALFVIMNTIKLGVFARRNEITFMRLCGATKSMIRMPFIVEGVIIGVFSAAVAFGLEFYLYQYLLRDIVASATNSAAGGGIIMGDFSGYALVLGLGFLAVGLFAGVISSSVSLKKYLKA